MAFCVDVLGVMQRKHGGVLLRSQRIRDGVALERGKMLSGAASLSLSSGIVGSHGTRRILTYNPVEMISSSIVLHFW